MLMRSFLIKILVFITITCTIGIFVQSRIEKINLLDNIDDKNFECIFDSIINADILIMGNSRSYTNYSTFVLDSIFNLRSYIIGISGYPIDFQYELKLLPYLKRNCSPQLIIQEINTIAFLDDANDPLNVLFLKYNYKSDFKYYNDYVNFSFYEKYLPLLKYKGMLNDELFHKELPIRSKAFKPQNYLDDGFFITKIDTAKLCKFYEYMDFCNRQKMKIIFVFSPIYHEMTDATINIEKFWDVIKKIASQYDVQILDYTHNSMCNDTSMFRDLTHLRKKGSELFSIKLAHDIDSLGLLK